MAAPASIGAYRIERLLGAGSFATVWLGHDPALGARVAVKVLAENWSHDLRVRERFLQEARLLWRLDHERIVRVYAAGELPDGRPYSVMDWADRGSLQDRLAAGPVSVETALWLLGEIAAGVAVLHARGIVHRDLTPGNVLFRSRRPVDAMPDLSLPDLSLPDLSLPDLSLPDAAGPERVGWGSERVLIADLGLAKALAAASGLTARAGTPGYMAPEQDDPLAMVDLRADVFGLGRLGARLLCVADRSGPELRHVLRPGVPPSVAEVLRAATAPRPADRHPDAAAFGDALRAAAGRAADPRAADPRAGSPTEPRAGYPTAPRARDPAGYRYESAPQVGHPPAARSGRLARRLAGLTAAVAVVCASVGTDAATVPSTVAVDAAGRISVQLPAGWRGYGSGWRGRVGDDGRLASALVVSPDPGRWSVDPTVPGAFVGLLPDGAALAGVPRRARPWTSDPRITAARMSAAGLIAARGFVAAQPHAACDAVPVRLTRQRGVDWVVARFNCVLGTPVIVEAAAVPPGSTALLYVQVAPPVQTGDAFIDTLLRGVSLRPTATATGAPAPR